ncbi:MAG: (d)CMP kinase [Candidatus Sericytochromatia bacterium]|nr:(d)CMP kinase [Candidatus Tanganyikabacteria bacterium]
MPLIVTLDGPAGAGKSTLARHLAQQLGWTYLDTGAMYRAVTWAAMDRGVDIGDATALGALARSLRLALLPGPDGARVEADGRDITEAIRSAAVTGRVSAVAAVAEVRDAMVAEQRRIGEAADLVAEGRDMGTVVFPDAPLKVYVTASPGVRAERRAAELARAGRMVDVRALEQELVARDALDSGREVAPLRPASDARHLLTDGEDVQTLLGKLLGWVGEIR